MDSFRHLEMRIVSSDEKFFELKDEWNNLLSSYSSHPPFLTWEWMYTWWSIYSSKYTSLHILVVSQGKTIISITPLYLKTNPFPFRFKTIYFLGTGEDESKEVCSEYLDIITNPCYTTQVCKMLASYIYGKNNIWDRVVIPRVLEKSILIKSFREEANKKGIKCIVNRVGARYFIQLPGSWEKYYSSLSSSMRRSISVAHKRLNKIPNVCCEKLGDSKEIKLYFNELKALHTQSWKMKGKPGAFSSNEFCKFHIQLAELFYKKNNLQLIRLTASNKTIGILYNFKISGVSYYYQSGLNMENFSKIKPGVLLHSEAIRTCIQEKMDVYDFMMGDESSYKNNYACMKSEMYHISLWNISFRARVLEKLVRLPYFKSIK